MSQDYETSMELKISLQYFRFFFKCIINIFIHFYFELQTSPRFFSRVERAFVHLHHLHPKPSKQQPIDSRGSLSLPQNRRNDKVITTHLLTNALDITVHIIQSNQAYIMFNVIRLSDLVQSIRSARSTKSPSPHPLVSPPLRSPPLPSQSPSVRVLKHCG